MARPEKNELPATLNEMMGKVPEISLATLPDILGEKMPELPFNRLGRMRLMRALRNRFGEGFRNIKGVKSLLAEFDTESKVRNVEKLNKES